MKSIPDEKNLFSLNICGTHDCVTQHIRLARFSRCQDKTIYEQLCLGVRALDIRVQSNGERLIMVHGIMKAYNEKCSRFNVMDMEDVLVQCYRFLDEHPSESILFQFKSDNGKENEKCFDNLFWNYIKGNEEKWFLQNHVPTLGEARGKIVLIRRCRMAIRNEFFENNTGIDFSSWVEQKEKTPDFLTLETQGSSNAVFLVQDRFKYKPEERWEAVITPFLKTMKPFCGTYIINYLSTAGGLKGVKYNAAYINAKFMGCKLDKDCYYGTVYVDFPSQELVEKIIGLNFN